MRHYRFEVQNGIAPLWTNVVVSLMAAAIGVVVTAAAACVMRWLRPLYAQLLYFISVLPAAVPGMVLGLGYIIVFNDPANPLEFLYGSLLILALHGKRATSNTRLTWPTLVVATRNPCA